MRVSALVVLAACGAPVSPAHVATRGVAWEPKLPIVEQEPHEPIGPLALAGRVVDAGDRPVAGAVVTLASRGERTAITARDGSFRFAGLRSRRYELWASTDTLGSVWTSVLLEKHTAPVVLRALETEPVTVRVVDRGGAAIPSARVFAAQRWRSVDAHGVVVVRGLPRLQPSRARLWAAAPGYAPLEADQQYDGVREDITFTLERGGRVAGTALAPDGSPLGNAVVRVKRSDEPKWTGYTRSDRTGAWHLDAVPAGKLEIAATSLIYTWGASREVTTNGITAVEALAVTAAIGHDVVGTVVDEAGHPVANADVEVVDDGPWEMSTDADGRFEARGLQKDSTTVVARAGRKSSAVANANMGSGPATVRLMLEDSMIAGRIVDGSGRPVAGAIVTAGDDSFELHSVVADELGRFELGPVARGRYTVQANRLGDDDLNADKTEVTAPATSAAIPVNPAGTLTGRIVSANAPADCSVAVLQSGEQHGRVKCVGGRFIATMSPGTYLAAIRGGFARITRTVTITDATTTDLGTIVAEPGRRIAGRVIDGIGRPVADARVVAAPHVTPDLVLISAIRELPDVYIEATAADGSFAIDEIPADAGALEIMAVIGGAGLAAPARTIRAGDHDVELQLTGNATVEVTLRGPASGVRYMIWFITANSQTRSPFHDSFSTALPAGHYRVVIVRGDDDPKSAPGRDIDVTEGTITKITLAAPP